ncbi:MAG TPA: outer membrane beta-barrel protein [Bryobacteraceae bacterium]|nr:outer membrane beta-barrel protein [Bryobacteraceae bacterium]
MLRSFFVIGIAAVCAAGLSAQEGVSKFTMQVGAGFTTPVGHSGKDLDLGWNMSGGAGVNFNSHVSALINLSEQFMGTSTNVPGFLSVSGGRMSVLSATLDPVYHLGRGTHADFYVTGGGGMFRRSFAPAYTQMLRSNYSVIKPGFDAGLGLAFGAPWHGKLYAEARYEHVFDNNRFFTNFIPVTFGFRW